MVGEKLNCGIISTGALIRDEINQDTQLGNKVSILYSQLNSIISKGDLISENDIDLLLMNKLKNYFTTQQQFIILDGYPRTKTQAIRVI